MIEIKKNEIAKQKAKAKNELLFNIFYVLLLSLSVTSLMVLYIDRLPSNIAEGEIATKTIRADQYHEFADEEKTQKARKEAADKALIVYNFDGSLSKSRRELISKSFVEARAFLGKHLKSEDAAHRFVKTKSGKKQVAQPVRLSQELENKLREQFQIGLGIVLSDDDYESIRKSQFSQIFEKSLLAILDVVQKRPIVLDKAQMYLRREHGFILRSREPGVENELPRETHIKDLSQVITLEEAKDFFKGREISEIQRKLNLEFIEESKIKAILKLIPDLVRVNVTFGEEETNLRRERAADSVQVISYKYKKGQLIISRGTPYERAHVIVLNGIRKKSEQTNIILKFCGIFILVLSFLLALYLFAKKTIKKFTPTKKDLNFLGFTIILFLALLRLSYFVSSNLQDAVPFKVDITTFYYVIPIAAGAMMVRFILNSEISLVFALLLSFFSGIFLELHFEITSYYLLSSLVACTLIVGVEKRSNLLKKGLYLGLANVPLVFSLNILNFVATGEPLDPNFVMTNCIFGFLGGLITVLTVLAVSPIMESLFNYTTNIQLLELANMNHPLLREMIVRAPGTYHHSQLVGILAEAGTRVIGGNSLLARVGSYYHDIGKMKKPQYFYENQKGVNPHDNLVPSMSALIIEAHVKDGLDLAKQHKLPSVISSFIPEHQGTKLIGYFYNKALKAAEGDKTQVDERSYRYEGPKPQSRESGVVMLADTVESAVRAMPDKSPGKVRSAVKKLVNDHFVDGQLDECELTLRDLHLIVDAFVKILVGIYHQRIEYPGQDDEREGDSTNNEGSGTTGHSGRQQSSKVSNISPLFKEKR